MKTKTVAPWKIRPGDFIILETLPRDIARDGAPRQFEVRSVHKFRGPFTGATVWQITYNDKSSSLGYGTTIYHGLRRSHDPRIADWKADKVVVPA